MHPPATPTSSTSGSQSAPGKYLRRLDTLEEEVTQYQKKCENLETRCEELEKWKRGMEKWLFDYFAVQLDDGVPKTENCSPKVTPGFSTVNGKGVPTSQENAESYDNGVGVGPFGSSILIVKSEAEQDTEHGIQIESVTSLTEEDETTVINGTRANSRMEADETIGQHGTHESLAEVKLPEERTSSNLIMREDVQPQNSLGKDMSETASASPRKSAIRRNGAPAVTVSLSGLPLSVNIVKRLSVDLERAESPQQSSLAEGSDFQNNFAVKSIGKQTIEDTVDNEEDDIAIVYTSPAVSSRIAKITKIRPMKHALIFPDSDSDNLPQLPHTSSERPLVSVAAEEQAEFEMETDDPTPCGVCGGLEPEHGNEMIFCDQCNLCVHQACYGVRPIPLGGWKCNPCQAGLTVAKLQCYFCPLYGGAMKPVRSPAKKYWAHVLCAIWIPEVKPESLITMEPIINVNQIPQARWKLRCSLCKNPQGACIQCQFTKRCTTAFHVTCALKHGLEMKQMGSDDPAEPNCLQAFCKTHTYISKKGNDTGRRKKKRHFSAKRSQGVTPKKKQRLSGPSSTGTGKSSHKKIPQTSAKESEYASPRKMQQTLTAETDKAFPRKIQRTSPTGNEKASPRRIQYPSSLATEKSSPKRVQRTPPKETEKYSVKED